MNAPTDYQSVFDFSATDIDGKTKMLSDFRGSVLLIVNVASHCGFTSQYKQLQELQDEYASQGFSILGFPCNQFMGQEPDEESKIRDFCSLTYNVSFPMFSKILVNGKDADPLYQFLKSNAKGVLGSESIKWNFTKFLVNRDGQLVARFAPATSPSSLSRSIEKELGPPRQDV